jgi:hypothetical protein
MRWYTDGLSVAQLQVLRTLGSYASQRQFYLGGGTALEIYLNHRQSLDLDWFTSDRITEPMMLAQSLRDAGIDFRTDQTAPGTLYGQVQEVKISFLEYRYPLLSPLVFWQEKVVSLASLDDLGCMKLSAVAQRGAKKDFYDIYALCTWHLPLERLLTLYQQKFAVTDIGPVLSGLVYFDDADEERDPLLLKPLSWNTVKQAIRNWIRAIT